MSTPILEVQSISKRFKLHHERKSYVTLRESLSSMFSSSKELDEDFWVLKNINFNVSSGESLGIIGRNGAGKSTLLKILSRISPPTSGKIISRGRIASLLEVGTGFHMELTGRENIFMNGSLLGMKRKEIKAKFEEIVDFAGVERFLDTPLKHYSSGMQLRLAFSVAAHLEPEVLIIDEVLAVGDAGFQRKCIGKMEEISKHGRTILFVSHNFSAVQSLCNRCIYLKGGGVESDGSPQDVIQEYLKDISENKANNHSRSAFGDEVAQLIDVRVSDSNGESVQFVDYSQSFKIEFDYEIITDGFFPTPNVHLSNVQSEKVFVAVMPKSQVPTSKGFYTARVEIPAQLLNPNSYIVGIALTSFETMKVHFYEPESIIFSVEEDINLRPHDFRQSIPGVIRPNLKWQ
ncbi:MAG: ABC transporter ATP-binding protein [Bacteroidia bacterium]